MKGFKEIESEIKSISLISRDCEVDLRNENAFPIVYFIDDIKDINRNPCKEFTITIPIQKKQ